MDAGDTWEYLYVLNRKRLVSAVLDPDVAQGKRSFLAGKLAVLHPRGFTVDLLEQCRLKETAAFSTGSCPRLVKTRVSKMPE